MKKKAIPPYKVVNWNFNLDSLVFYDIMPYLVDCWERDKKRTHKLWCIWSKGSDDTKMPESFEEFKAFVLGNSHYQFWSRCEYEVIVTGWPKVKKEHKLDVYEQIEANIDVITKHFMDFII